MSASTRNRLRRQKLQKQQHQQHQQSKPLHFSPLSNIIAYQWPEIYVPRTSFTRYIVEKFLFYSNQIFIIDGQSGSQFTYRHILVDSLKTAGILRANNVTSESSVAIIGGNCYEHVCTFFAAMLLDAKVVLVNSTASKEQIMAAVRTCGISYLAVIKPKGQQQGQQHSSRTACTAQLRTLVQQCRNPYLMAFGDGEKDLAEEENSLLEGISSYTVFEESPINSKYLGLQRRANSENRWNRTRLIIPKLRGSKVLKCYHIKEYSLMSQLTYATLPQSGFEWNINDVILNMWPLSRLLGIFELLVTLSVGARIVLHRHDDSAGRYASSATAAVAGGRQVRMEVEELSELVARHGITAAVLHSSYLLDLVKWTKDAKEKDHLSLSSLEKVLYTEQPIHRNIVSAFRKKYSITNCRYGYFLHEASGFAAIEVINYANSSAVSVTPLPSMEIVVVNRTTGALNGHGQLGKIFIRSPYCATVELPSLSTSSTKPKTADGWVFSGFIGYYDSNTYLQVIDHYSNFSKSEHTFISKTLVETVLLSHPGVARAVAMKNATRKSSNNFQAFVTLKESDPQQQQQQECSEEALGTYLNSYLNDNRMVWSVAIVQRLPRSSASHRIITRRLKKSVNVAN